MRARLLLLATLLAAACTTSVSGSRAMRSDQLFGEELAGGQFNALVGLRDFAASSTWQPLDEQLALGLDFVYGPRDALLQWDISVLYAFDDTSTALSGGADRASAETWEVGLGMLHFFRFGSEAVVPYLGGGVSLLHVDTELLAGGLVDDSDWSFGGYARAGMQFRFREYEHIGLDLRVLGGTDLDLAGGTTHGDAIVLSLIFGNQF